MSTQTRTPTTAEIAQAPTGGHLARFLATEVAAGWVPIGLLILLAGIG